jgi:hypothetical protein
MTDLDDDDDDFDDEENDDDVGADEDDTEVTEALPPIGDPSDPDEETRT